MDSNINKKIILSITSISILIIVVVGLSFAFFTYINTSAKNNLISAGRISFNFLENDTLSITNAFPISTADGLAQVDSNVCSFTINGYASSGQTINYKVYAVPGDPVGTRSRFVDDVVFLNIKRTDESTNCTFTGSMNYYDTNASAIVMTNDQLELGTGTITSTSEVTMNFEVRIWLDDSKIFISDTEIQENQPGKIIYDTATYANSYYSLKIIVEATS